MNDVARSAPRRLPGSRAFAVIGLIGGLVLALGAVVAPERTTVAYAVVWIEATFMALGGLLFLQIVHTMNAKWPLAVRRPIEALAGTLPWLAILFVPLALRLDAVYPWLRPQSLEPGVQELLQTKLAWLDRGFFVARAAACLVFWSVLAWWLRRASLRSTSESAGADKVRMRAVSAAALPAVALTLTFAGFDWLMSLDPAWFSSIFGIYVFAGGFLSAVAVVTVIAADLDLAGHLPDTLRPSHHYALGRLLLTFVVFWAYIAFFQLLLIWIADKPVESHWYVVRWDSVWRWVSVAVGLGMFAIPFVYLLSYRTKRSPARLLPAAIWLLAVHHVESLWMVVPATAGPPVHWSDLGALAAAVGLMGTLVTRGLRRAPLLPLHDPDLQVGLEYESE